MIIGIDGNEANVKNRVGSGQFAFEVLKNLIRVDKKNTYKVYLKDKPLADMPKEGKNLGYVSFGPQKLWTQFALPIRLFLGQKPDVFFSPSHYAPRFAPCPTVITIFDLSYILFPNLFRKGDLYQLDNWTRYSISKASVVITISESSKKDISSHYDISPNKVFVSYPGYDKSLYKPRGEDEVGKIKRKYKISGDYLFYLGTIQPRKNLILLLDAFDSMNRELKTDNLQLVIAGKRGWLYDEFFEKAQMMRDKIRIIDFAPLEDLPALYSGAKAFILPSLYEGFGIPVLEAMACSCPVVISNVSSLPEVGGEAAVYVDPESEKSIKEGILKVVENSQYAKRLSELGLKQAKKFSWEKCAGEVLKVLENVS